MAQKVNKEMAEKKGKENKPHAAAAEDKIPPGFFPKGKKAAAEDKIPPGFFPKGKKAETRKEEKDKIAGKEKEAEKKIAGNGMEEKETSNEKEKIAGKGMEEKEAGKGKERATEEKKAGKAGEGKGEKKTGKEASKKKRKVLERVELKKLPKGKQVKLLRELVKLKKRRMFRGRFGNRSVRRISKEKWQRWRMPRGMDIHLRREDGLFPKTGYRTAALIRAVHPSGFRQQIVRNVAEIEVVAAKKDSVAAMISGTIGRKKRVAMLRKANELGVFVLNG